MSNPIRLSKFLLLSPADAPTPTDAIPLPAAQAATVNTPVMRRSSPSPTDLRIADGLRRGDPDAVRALYAEYGPRTLAEISATLGDRNAAEDVFQQVLLEAWLRCDSYDPARASLRTWLATIARSRAIDHLRRRIPEPLDPTDATEDRAARWQREPCADVVDRMVVDGLLARLSPGEAEVVRLHFHLGFSQSQIVARTGIPLGTVKSRLASALRRLRAMLEEEERTPPAAGGAREVL
jgi:RNA polymerase sigma-70 factor (ECF subfamily)